MCLPVSCYFFLCSQINGKEMKQPVVVRVEKFKCRHVSCIWKGYFSTTAGIFFGTFICFPYGLRFSVRRAYICVYACVCIIFPSNSNKIVNSSNRQTNSQPEPEWAKQSNNSNNNSSYKNKKQAAFNKIQLCALCSKRPGKTG